MKRLRNQAKHLAIFFAWLIAHVRGNTSENCSCVCTPSSGYSDICDLVDEIDSIFERRDELLQNCSSEFSESDDAAIESVAQEMLQNHFHDELEKVIDQRISKEVIRENACKNPDRHCFCEFFDADSRDPADAKLKEIEIRYKCDAFFIMTGNRALLCKDGKWDGYPPVCSCPPGTFGFKCNQPCHCEGSFYCDVETGACTIGCAEGWVGAACNIEASCETEPPAIANGKVAPFDRKPGSNVNYECNENFMRFGHSTVRCSFGKWEGDPPFCSCRSGLYGANCNQSCHCKMGPNSCDEETGACHGGCATGWVGEACNFRESCGPPPEIENGYAVEGNMSYHGDIIKYACRGNMTLREAKIKLKCHFEQFIGERPKCVERCRPGHFGANCNQSCHCKMGPNSCDYETGACLGGCATGWVGDACNFRGSCGPPPAIQNGYPVEGNRSYHGDSIKYACRGDMTLLEAKQKLKCHFEQFIGERPKCVEHCNSSSLIGRVPGLLHSTDKIVKHLETLAVTCLEGYYDVHPYLLCLDGTFFVPYDPCIKSYFHDQFFLVIIPRLKSSITCMRDEEEDEIHFSRVLDTGNGKSLPRNFNIITGRQYSQIDTTDVRVTDYFGVFECAIREDEGSVEIVTVIQSYEFFFPNDTFKVANLGDTVKLEVRILHIEDLPIRWRHNGVDVPSWNGGLKVEIFNVQTSDAGIYECFYEGRWKNSYHAIMRLIVRKCKADLFGKDCDQICPICLNGGICHDVLGMCLCRPGFMGANCDKACEPGVMGFQCMTKCRAEGAESCNGMLICRPDPLGCTCPAGFTGKHCNKRCQPGWYGADCKQPCQCANKTESCNRFTGVCESGCSSGWTGDACKIVETCGAPPTIDNGYPVDGNKTYHHAFVKYACHGNRTLVEKENKLMCHFGKLSGDPPECDLN